MRVVVDDGTAISYRVDGPDDAPVLVFSNSLGADLRMWDSQVDSLCDLYRTVRYDSRGHGDSDAPHGDYTLDRLGQDLLALLDHLDLECAHVCGLSLGGLVALWLASSHPERVDRAIFANASARIGTIESWSARIEAVRTGGMQAIRETVVNRFLSASFRDRHPEVAQWVGDMVEATPAEGYIGSCAALRDADLRGKTGLVTAPSLIIAGALDEATPVAQAGELQRAIGESELVVLEGASHLSNLEQPDSFNQLVSDFLRRC